MKTLFTLLLTSLILVSCGKDRDGTTTPTTLAPEVITGNTVGQVDTIEELRDQFDDLSLTVSTSFNSAIGLYDNNGDHKFKYSISGSNLVTQIVDANGDAIDNFSDTKEEIIDQIFDTSKFGEAQSARLAPISLCILNTNSGDLEQILGYVVTHSLLNGDSVERVVSPDLPLHLNPVYSSHSQNEDLFWIFDTVKHFGLKNIYQLGLSYRLIYNCN